MLGIILCSQLKHRLKIFDDFRLCHNFLGDLADKKSAYFRERVDVLNKHPVRVAIIDNGVDKVRTTLFGKIDNGISFVKTLSGDRILPWWMVADPHGTQMASLIQAINPFCRLYIARVGKRRDDIDSEKAAEVSSCIEISFSCLCWRNKSNLNSHRLSDGQWTKKSTSSRSAGSHEESRRN
jgi:hypothetical protein